MLQSSVVVNVLKVLLTKLLLEKPTILLLDEPTNYLDVEHIQWLQNYLQELRKCVHLDFS